MGTAAFAMRLGVIGAVVVAALACAGCEQFDPVKSDNLCERNDGHAISMLCPQCSSKPFAWNCSECFKMVDPDPETCEPNRNPATNAGDGGRGGRGGAGGGEAGSEAGAGGASGDGGSGEGGQGGGGGEGGSSGGGGSGGMSGGDSGAGGGPVVDPLTCIDDLWCSSKDALQPACKEGRCVECTENKHCSGEQPVCDPNLNRCLTCRSDEDCESGRCNEALNVCVECEADMDCKDSIKDSCDTQRFICVDCVGPAGCADDDPDGIKTTCYVNAYACVDCLDNVDCGGDKPACNQQTRECVGCNTSADCSDPVKNQCDPMAKTCVDCMDNAGCAGPNPQCDRDAHTCVECLQDTHCPSGHCVDQQCVECKVDDDCPSVTASHCDPQTHMCVGCTSNTHCGHLDDTPACNARRCVECNDDTTCGGFACIRAQHVCSDVRTRSLGNCAPCQADSMCAANTWCIPMQFDGETYGNFCAYSRQSRQGSSCTNARPYSRAVSNVRSIDGMTQSYCVPPASTTCQGVLDATSILGGISCADPADCGVDGLIDAQCNENRRCTYGCTMDTDCPSNTTCLANLSCG